MLGDAAAPYRSALAPSDSAGARWARLVHGAVALAVLGGIACTAATPRQTTGATTRGVTPTASVRAGPGLLQPPAPSPGRAQAVPYPADWPPDLQFPAAFVLVTAQDATFPGRHSSGWTATLQYPGASATAADVLTSFFQVRGWQVERAPASVGVVYLRLQKPETGGDGGIAIAADATGGQTAALTVFLRR